MSRKQNIKHLVAEVLTELGQTDDNMTPIIKSWIYNGMREIGNSELNIKESDWLPISNLAFDKPCGLIAPIRITISTNKTSCVTPFMRQDMARCSCCENCSCECEIHVGETDDQFFLSSNGTRYLYGKVRYIGTPVDADGEPLVDERCSRAVKAYVNLMYQKQRRNMDKDSTPMSEIDYANTQWINLMRQAKGRLGMPSIPEMQGIGSANLNAGISFASFEGRHGQYWNHYWGSYPS